MTLKEKEMLNMKVLVLSNGEIKEREINNELKDLQEIVGGYIEIPPLGETFRKNGINVIINEEGKFIEGLKPEIAIVDENSGRILDVVYGNCIFASHDEEGEMIELDEKQKQVVMEELSQTIELTKRDTLEEFKVRVLLV
jgi:hypothetical protein